MTQISSNPLDSSSIRFLPAGYEWDAIRVPRYLGLAALRHLRSEPGRVLVDPHERALFFFVLPGSADRWQLPEARVFGITQYVAIPPSHRNAPPGLYWLAHPRGDWVTSTTVQIGDRVQTRIGANPVEVRTIQPLARGDRRLHLADGTTTTPSPAATSAASPSPGPPPHEGDARA